MFSIRLFPICFLALGLYFTFNDANEFKPKHKKHSSRAVHQKKNTLMVETLKRDVQENYVYGRNLNGKRGAIFTYDAKKRSSVEGKVSQMKT